MPALSRQIVCLPSDGREPYTVQEFIGGDVSAVLSTLRSQAFLLAISGKHGSYPQDSGLMDAVEKGFSPDGTQWKARDGLVLKVIKGEATQQSPENTC